MTANDARTSALPPALTRGVLVRDGVAVIRPKLVWAGAAWLSVALCAAIAVGMPLDMVQRVADGEQGVDMAAVLGIAAAFGLLALGMAGLAVRLGRRAWRVDATGLAKLNWRRAAVDWPAVTAIDLRRSGRYWQLWVHAPGAVRLIGRPRPADRLIVPCTVLAPRPADLHAYLTLLWQNGKST